VIGLVPTIRDIVAAIVIGLSESRHDGDGREQACSQDLSPVERNPSPIRHGVDAGHYDRGNDQHAQKHGLEPGIEKGRAVDRACRDRSDECARRGRTDRSDNEAGDPSRIIEAAASAIQPAGDRHRDGTFQDIRERQSRSYGESGSEGHIDGHAHRRDQRQQQQA
jgi:hypothetical protein